MSVFHLAAIDFSLFFSILEPCLFSFRVKPSDGVEECQNSVAVVLFHVRQLSFPGRWTWWWTLCNISCFFSYGCLHQGVKLWAEVSPSKDQSVPCTDKAYSHCAVISLHSLASISWFKKILTHPYIPTSVSFAVTLLGCCLNLCPCNIDTSYVFHPPGSDV